MFFCHTPTQINLLDHVFSVISYVGNCALRYRDVDDIELVTICHFFVTKIVIDIILRWLSCKACLVLVHFI